MQQILKNAAALIALSLTFAIAPACAEEQKTMDTAKKQESKNPHILFSTSLGDITIELLPDKAPVTVKNFIDYVESGFYNDTIFHRIIPDFMIQGGGFAQDMQQKETRPPIKNEADNGMRNARGTVAMARTRDINSATAQFFINLKDNTFLDHGVRDYGYAVFGRVIEGMDVVDKIAAVRTTTRSGHQNVPVEPVIVKSAAIK